MYDKRGITKDLPVIITQIRALPVIETGWELYPCYYEVTGKMDFISYGLVKTVHKGDFIVWDDYGNAIPLRKNVWNKLYGKYLMGDNKNVYSLEQ